MKQGLVDGIIIVHCRRRKVFFRLNQIDEQQLGIGCLVEGDPLPVRRFLLKGREAKGSQYLIARVTRMHLQWLRIRIDKIELLKVHPILQQLQNLHHLLHQSLVAPQLTDTPLQRGETTRLLPNVVMQHQQHSLLLLIKSAYRNIKTLLGQGQHKAEVARGAARQPLIANATNDFLLIKRVKGCQPASIVTQALPAPMPINRLYRDIIKIQKILQVKGQRTLVLKALNFEYQLIPTEGCGRLNIGQNHLPGLFLQNNGTTQRQMREIVLNFFFNRGGSLSHQSPELILKIILRSRVPNKIEHR